MPYSGIVQNGVIVLQNGDSLPEGTRVHVDVLGSEPNAETLGQRLLKFAGTAHGLPRDMAEHHDHYLHGRLKE
ncbi:MAG TPA: hypothetical protein VG013_01310 [Gemmataceae bacterium]|nr:hypothetical protein [Gemmataceae bacterium]